ncbi:hypothetical protein, partial [Plasmodium yoelii yoelii]
NRLLSSLYFSTNCLAQFKYSLLFLFA